MLNKNQKFSVTAITVSLILILQLSCTAKVPTDLTKESIIPKPVSITATGEMFTLNSGTMVYFQGESAEMKQISQYIADRLKPATGFAIEIKSASKAPKSGIYLTLAGTDIKKGDESYVLTITRNLVELSAKSPAGLFRGVQTLRQILPPKIENTTIQKGPWEIATGTITDYPDYSYRGVMLDVSRHFFGVTDVKRFIDLISYYKINMLHLHLSDDQGWRIEIKSWPNLATHGGSTQVGGGAGGYYTQDQYSEIVKYAQERYITIIPEIDMPGHTNAALASYAELNCSGKATELYTGIEVGFSSLCTTKDITYKFIDDVVKELAALTPGPYIHIGGDESHSTKKEDYIPFINKVQDIVASHGKQVIGWDDISVATIKPNSYAQHWANVKNANEAVKQGAKIIMSPSTKAYLDMQYDKSTKLGLHWAAYIEVDSAYQWDPATLIPGVAKENILGVEAALWTETITKMDDIEYMVFPRLPGIAEIGWTATPQRNWNEYKESLARQGERFKVMGIDYYQSKLVPWSEEKK
jgi:hexosaminidase